MKTFLQRLITIVVVMSVSLTSSFSVFASPEQQYIEINTYGEGEPVILIPGLMSDGTVWKSTVDALSADYELHVVNVAGFGTTPSAEGTTAERVEQAIVDYIQEQNLRTPIVIGHSFGGFMALALAINNDVEIKKVVSVDGLPYIGPIFTRTNSTTVEDLRGQANQIHNLYRQLNHEQLIAQTRMGIAIQATSDDAQKQVLSFAGQSDPGTVGQIMHDLLVRDLRTSLVDDPTPILLLGASGAFADKAKQDAAKTLYEEQLAQTPNAKVIMNSQSRHFIMYDDSAWLNERITAFLGE